MVTAKTRHITPRQEEQTPNKATPFLHAILPHPTAEICNLTNHRTDPAKSNMNLVHIKMNEISSSNII